MLTTNWFLVFLLTQIFVSSLTHTSFSDALKQGSLSPGLWPARNQAAQQEVSGRQVSEASSAAPHRSHFHLNAPPDLPHYCLNHSPPLPSPQKNCLPRNRSLVPKRLGTAALKSLNIILLTWNFLTIFPEFEFYCL